MLVSLQLFLARHSRGTTLSRTALVAALLVMPATHYEPAFAALSSCSPAVGLGVRSQNETILLATASPDTLATRHGVIPGGGGRGQAPDASASGYGQLFQVQRFGGADSASLARAFRVRGNNNVAIVPWDYDPACGLHHRVSNFVWVRSVQPGVFVLRLRPDSLWSNGTPVLDAFATSTLPWPHAEVFRSTTRFMRTAVELSAAEYFDLLLAMPTREEKLTMPDSAWALFLRWRADNLVLAGRFPANQIADELSGSIVREKINRAINLIEPVIAGTYRMSLSLNRGPPREFWLRTSSRAHDEWHATLGSPVRDPAAAIAPPDAYSIMAGGALSREMLSRNCRNADGYFATGYMYVIQPQHAPSGDVRQWHGWIEMSLVASQFPGDSAMDSFRLRAFDEWEERMRGATDYEAPALFELGSDGVFTVAQTIRLGDGRSVVMTGTRVSREAVRCD